MQTSEKIDFLVRYYHNGNTLIKILKGQDPLSVTNQKQVSLYIHNMELLADKIRECDRIIREKRGLIIPEIQDG